MDRSRPLPIGFNDFIADGPRDCRLVRSVHDFEDFLHRLAETDCNCFDGTNIAESEWKAQESFSQNSGFLDFPLENIWGMSVFVLLRPKI